MGPMGPIVERMEKNLGNFSNFLGNARARLEFCEGRISPARQQLSSEGIRKLCKARRLLNAAEDYTLKLNRCIEAGDKSSISRAVSIYESPIVIPQDSVNTVFGSESINRVAPSKIAEEIDPLIKYIEEELGIIDRRRVSQS